MLADRFVCQAARTSIRLLLLIAKRLQIAQHRQEGTGGLFVVFFLARFYQFDLLQAFTDVGYYRLLDVAGQLTRDEYCKQMLKSNINELS